MVVDMVSQPQLTEVFTTNHSHHRSSSTHRRNSSTINQSSTSTSSDHATMTNGQRVLSDELGRKAEQILGHAKEILDYRRQSSMDLQAQHPFRLNITETKPNSQSRNVTSSTSVHNPPTSTSSLSAKAVSPDHLSGKNRRVVTVEQLVPLIFQLVAAPKFLKFSEIVSKDSRSMENVLNSREMKLVSHRESVVQLSDDENEDEDDDDDDDDAGSGPDDEQQQPTNIDSSKSVLIDITDKRTANNNNSINQNNSNDNPPHRYENQTEIEHSGQSSSRCHDNDSEDDDSDNQEAAHSDAENDDQSNSTNANTLSLMDFVSRHEPVLEPVLEPSAKQSMSPSPSADSFGLMKKRSISPSPERREQDHHVHNSEDHQNKRKKLLIKRALLKSFVSSVNTPIDIKRPSLPITIPTHLLFDKSLSDSIGERTTTTAAATTTSKRHVSGTFKHDAHADVIDSVAATPTVPLHNQTSAINGPTHQKKNKTSHTQEKTIVKAEPPTTLSTLIKNESNANASAMSTNETDNRTRTSSLPINTQTTTDLIPLTMTTTTSQPKKEKPTANVRPLQQTTPIDALSSSNPFNTVGNTSDSLAATSTRSMLPSTKMNLLKLKNMSKTDLAALARKKKKLADNSKRTTFVEAREVMSLYLESVCYFIQCANDESKLDQRTPLLSTTLTMLQQLMSNHQKLFHVSNQSIDLLSNIRKKFLLINYWLQSFIHHLQFNTSMPNIERSANQVTEYFQQMKNPSSASSLTKSSQQQLTPINDSNPISPLSVTSQTSASDSSTSQQQEQHRYIYDFSKLMLNSYYSTCYWNKADRLMRDKSLKEFTEQLWKQNQNRRLSRDDTTLDFLLYVFDGIELLRLSEA